eukprot:64553-Hanusia_phi.AAC.5
MSQTPTMIDAWKRSESQAPVSSPLPPPPPILASRHNEAAVSAASRGAENVFSGEEAKLLGSSEQTAEEPAQEREEVFIPKEELHLEALDEEASEEGKGGRDDAEEEETAGTDFNVREQEVGNQHSISMGEVRKSSILEEESWTKTEGNAEVRSEVAGEQEMGTMSVAMKGAGEVETGGRGRVEEQEGDNSLTETAINEEEGQQKKTEEEVVLEAAVQEEDEEKAEVEKTIGKSTADQESLGSAGETRQLAAGQPAGVSVEEEDKNSLKLEVEERKLIISSLLLPIFLLLDKHANDVLSSNLPPPASISVDTPQPVTSLSCEPGQGNVSLLLLLLHHHHLLLSYSPTALRTLSQSFRNPH